MAAADVPTLRSVHDSATRGDGPRPTGAGLFRWDMSGPPGGATTPHFHKTFSESFYVIDGRIGLYDGIEWREGGRRLPVPAPGRHPCFPERERGPGLDAHPVRSGRRARHTSASWRNASRSGHQGTNEERTAFLARHDQYEV